MTAARIAIALAFAGAACARTAGEPPRVAVTLGDRAATVEVTGALRAVDATPVQPPALPGMGLLKLTWIAPEGSEVAAGDRLVELDASDLEASLEAARGDAAQADKQLERKRQELALARREGELRLLSAESDLRKAALKADLPPELVPAIERKERQLDRELADRRLDRARREVAASRHSDEVDLGDQIDTRDTARRRIAELEASRALLTIAAPRAGTVVYGPGTGGDARNTGDAFWQSDVILQVVALDAMAGDATIDEIDLGRVAVGQPVTVQLDALPDLTVRGSVASVATRVIAASDADPGKLVQLQIAIAPSAGAGLRPGMRFHGGIEVGRIEVGGIEVAPVAPEEAP